MNCYLDTSVLLRAILNQKNQFTDWNQIENAFTSELLLVECRRAIDRYRLDGQLTDEDVAACQVNIEQFVVGMTVYKLDSEIIDIAKQPFPTVIGTLDALHLATAMLWKKQNKLPLTLITHDSQLATAAKACGIAVLGV